MNNIEKLRVMLPHWIEHNHGHGHEFSLWADKLTVEKPEIAVLLRRAVKSLQDAETALEDALGRVGGPSEEGHTHHHGSGHHH
ncbi:MAG: hypothetical protein DSY58_09055 [Desulfobulbus sp.]|nr:MAG: hypothetical protein DSY58_09055 [Desulfobulbus sp.]